MYESDSRTVMTLDAGGTNFVFSAIRGCREVVEPVRLDAVTDDVDRCLAVLVEGFRRVEQSLEEAPVAISFAFPGPADYEAGVIGDLPNFTSARYPRLRTVVDVVFRGLREMYLQQVSAAGGWRE